MLILHREYTGMEFNEYHKQKNTKFYKFLNNDLTHYGFKYQLGVNIDTEQFNPTRECSKGGFYFCTESDYHFYFYKYGTKLASIEIPDDARVYVEKNKFKSDKIIIKEIRDFIDVDNNVWINMIYKDGRALQYVKEELLTEELCMLAVRQNGLVLEFVKKQTSKICKLAVRQDAYALQYVINQNEKVCEIAVRQEGDALEYVEKRYKTRELCTLAVEQNGLALWYVENQTASNLLEICILAVQQNGLALECVTNQTDKICEIAVRQNGLALEYVHNQTEKICRLAVQQNGLALQYVKQTDEICKLFINNKTFNCDNQYPIAKWNNLSQVEIIKSIEQIIENICILAVKQNKLALEFVKIQTDEICTVAITHNRITMYWYRDFISRLEQNIEVSPFELNIKALRFVKNECLKEKLHMLVMQQNK